MNLVLISDLTFSYGQTAGIPIYNIVYVSGIATGKQQIKIKQAVSSISDLRKTFDSGSRLYFALDPLTNAVEDDLIDDLKRQIFEYMKKMRV